MNALALAAAKEVLEEAKEERPEALARLHDAVARLLPEALAAVGPPPEHGEPVDGLHGFDARAVAYLRSMGAEGSDLGRAAAEVAQNYARSAREDWQRVVTGDLSQEDWSRSAQAEVARAVAWALWEGEVRAEVNRAQGRLPGVIVDVHEGVALALTKDLRVDNGQLFRPHPRGGAPLAVADVPVVSQNVLDAAIITGRGLRLYGSLYALPVVEYLVELAHVGFGAEGVSVGAEGGKLIFDSWELFVREALRLPGKPRPQVVTDVRLTARMLAHTPIRWPDGMASSALWVLEDDDIRAGPPRHGPRFALTPRLQAGETFRARKGRNLGGREREGLRIVPLLRPRIVPPVPDSNPKSFGAQASFVRFLWLHFVKHREKLWDQPSGIPVTEVDVADLAAMAQLTNTVAVRMLGHLLTCGVIVSPAPGLYTPADQATREFMKDGGSPERRKNGIARQRRPRR